MNIQVLVVGAGPVGLTLAGELARYGISVRIIDSSAQRTDKSKALVLWSRTLELLARSGSAEPFVAAGHKVDAANIIAGAKVIGHIALTGVDSPYPFALMLPQSETERILEEQLNALGIFVERERTLTHFDQSEGTVACQIRDGEGQVEALDVRWLAGCDGAHSTVRHGLNLAFDGDTLLSDWMLADIHLSGYPVPESEIANYWHEEGVLVLFPIAPGRFRMIADLGLSRGALPAAPTLSQVQVILDARGPGGMVASDPIWLSSFRINERKVTDYRSGNVFVAGDAAHVHSPAGGQGMNTGMQDAFNLAWKLALVCAQRCSAELLASYSVERSAVGDQVLLAAGRLTKVAVMKNHAAQAVRNVLGRVVLGIAPVRDAIVDTMMEVSIGYPVSPLNGHAVHGVAGLAAGQRVRPRGGEPATQAGQLPLFTLGAADGHAARHWLEQNADLVDSRIAPPLTTDGLCLIRPDGYVACVTPADDFEGLAAYLNRLRQTPTAPRPL